MILHDLIHLFYPTLCLGCGTDQLPKDELLCTHCFSTLPYTSFEKIKDNPVEKIFFGKVDVESAFSIFYFNKGLVLQAIIHQLKYKNNPGAGEYLGKLMGQRMAEANLTFDYIVPVPLHPRKLHKRGYNQAYHIALGIGDVLQTPVEESNVIRAVETETQTKKTREERWKNVKSAFEIEENGLLKNKHILLADDVITTGSTIEACVQQLQKVEGIKISVASVAIAD